MAKRRLDRLMNLGFLHGKMIAKDRERSEPQPCIPIEIMIGPPLEKHQKNSLGNGLSHEKHTQPALKELQGMYSFQQLLTEKYLLFCLQQLVVEHDESARKRQIWPLRARHEIPPWVCAGHNGQRLEIYPIHNHKKEAKGAQSGRTEFTHHLPIDIVGVWTTYQSWPCPRKIVRTYAKTGYCFHTSRPCMNPTIRPPADSTAPAVAAYSLLKVDKPVISG